MAIFNWLCILAQGVSWHRQWESNQNIYMHPGAWIYLNRAREILNTGKKSFMPPPTVNPHSLKKFQTFLGNKNKSEYFRTDMFTENWTRIGDQHQLSYLLNRICKLGFCSEKSCRDLDKLILICAKKNILKSNSLISLGRLT